MQARLVGLFAVFGVAIMGAVALGANAATGGVPDQVMQWVGLAQKYAQVYANLDPAEILACIWNESTGDPNASNPGDPSWGLMGVTMLIGQAYAQVTDPSQLTDPETNVRAGAGYLSALKNEYSGQYADWPDAYNVGETKFNKGVRSPLINGTTYSQRFYSHVTALDQTGQV